MTARGTHQGQFGPMPPAGNKDNFRQNHKFEPRGPWRSEKLRLVSPSLT